MRVMVMMKGTDAIEAQVQPSEQMMKDMLAFNEELVKAGMMISGEGLKPSSAGKRIAFKGRGNPVVTDGPFAETKELIAGFWIINVKDEAEALSWARKVPFDDGEIELRPYHEPEDFEGYVTDEVMEQEKGWRDEQAAKAPKVGA